MSDIPVIHTTKAELATDRFWIEHLEPITRAHGVPAPTELHRDPGDDAVHLLRHSDGRLLAVVRTDRPACPTCGR